MKFTPFNSSTLIPILAKETRLMLRGRRAVVSLMVLLFTLSAGFVLFWAEFGRFAAIGVRTTYARSMFTSLSAVQFVGFMFLIPTMTAAAVTSEREAKTFDLLFTTGISRFQILIAKYFSILAYQLIVMVLVLPILSLIFQLGGVGADEYIAAAFVILEVGLTYAMVGLAYSCWFQRTFPSLVATVLTLAGFVVLLPLGISIVAEMFGIRGLMFGPFGRGGPSEDLVWAISPFFACLKSADKLMNSGESAIGTLLGSHTFLMHLGYQLVIFLSASLMGWKGLSRGERSRAQVAKKIIDDQSILERRRKTWPYYLIDPLRRPQAIDDKQNPAYVKERRTGGAPKPQTLVRMGYLGFAVSLIFMLAVLGGSTYETVTLLGTISIVFIMIVTPLFASTGISREREMKTLDLLQGTTLTPRQIILGKFRAGLPAQTVLCVSVLLLPFTMAPFIPHHYQYYGAWGRYHGSPLGVVLGIVPAIASFVLFYSALAVMISSLSSRSAGAIVGTYLTFLGLALFPFILTMVMMLLGYDYAGRWAPRLGADLRFLEVTRNLFGPVVSPFYFMSRPNYESDPTGWHYFSDPNSWLQIAGHSALVLLMAWLFLRIAENRLTAGRQ